MSEFTNQNQHAPSAQSQETPSGFSFENVHRDTMIEQIAKNASSSNAPVGYLPQATKNGTTIVGLVYKGGVRKP